MRSFIKTISLLILITSCKEKLSEPEHFFGTIDLRDGNYKLVGFGLEGLWVDDFRNFYVDDLTTLQKMQRQWIFEYAVPPSPCGYGYKLKLMRDTIVINEALVNIDCEYMNANEQPWRYFPANYLTDHKASFKRFTEEDRSAIESMDGKK
jgi:hypothetical protein